MSSKIRIAIICNFSNQKIQKKLNLKMSFFEKCIRKIIHKPTLVSNIIEDFAIWNSNAFEEFEKLTDIAEVHVISPYKYLRPYLQEFELNGLFYHFLYDTTCSMKSYVKSKLFQTDISKFYNKVHLYIKKYIAKINPNIVYIIGAENPLYSLSALDIPKSIPVAVHLQTLINDPDFEKNYPISHDDYIFRANCELQVLKRANYIMSSVEKFKEIIKDKFLPNANILRATLAVGENIVLNKNIEKKYDFVYFASNINKAFDLALEGFALVHNIFPNCTLHVIGAYENAYKTNIDRRIKELKVSDNITFTGRLKTHNDVLIEIQKAKIALLPLKIDITSSTIREAIACELPVVTTITPKGTPTLNEKRETVLLSKIGDNQALADNMLLLMNNPNLADKLKHNGKLLLNEKYSNTSAVKRQLDCLIVAYKHFADKDPIPGELIL